MQTSRLMNQELLLFHSRKKKYQSNREWIKRHERTQDRKLQTQEVKLIQAQSMNSQKSKSWKKNQMLSVCCWLVLLTHLYMFYISFSLFRLQWLVYFFVKSKGATCEKYHAETPLTMNPSKMWTGNLLSAGTRCWSKHPCTAQSVISSLRMAGFNHQFYHQCISTHWYCTVLMADFVCIYFV